MPSQPQQTLIALRQAVYARLTTPPIQYTYSGANWSIGASGFPGGSGVNGSVVPRGTWETMGAPLPAVVYNVGGLKARDIALGRIGERRFDLVVQTVSQRAESECSAIAEQVLLLLNYADQDSIFAGGDLSRAATAGTLQVCVRLLEAYRISETSFETQTRRWYQTTEFTVDAI